MRINTNIAALTAVYQLNSADSKLSISLEKLSSGNKLADIKENPVGASLSVKMKTQIRNLDRASQNTADGISVAETAESALAEIQSMLQRINELVVQGATDTYTDEDRKNIAAEIEQINQEITRVSTDTDFNTRTLLDGTFSRVTYTQTNAATVTSVSSEVDAGTYEFIIHDVSSEASVTTGTFSQANLVSGNLNINGADVAISESDSLQDIYDKFSEAAKKTGLELSYTGSLTGSASFTFTQKETGSDYTVDISTSDEVANALGLSAKEVTSRGTDAEISLGSGFSNTATVAVSGRNITIKDPSGFEMKVSVDDTFKNATGNIGRVVVGVADAGAMTIQVGANEYQELDIEIPRIDAETLGTDKILSYTSRGCSEAITISQNAISRVSEVRGKLGAYQNRMEHTISTLDVTEENMTASLSRIADVDMAEEMTNYTTQNVMTQAATSMLAQANQLSERVLQLLQS